VKNKQDEIKKTKYCEIQEREKEEKKVQERERKERTTRKRRRKTCKIFKNTTRKIR